MARVRRRGVRPRSLNAALTALRNELNNDPTSLGYAPLIAAGNHQALADALNLARAGISVQKSSLMASEIMGVIVLAEYTALTAASRDYLNVLMTSGTIPGTSTVRSNLASLFPSGSQTRTALVALADKSPASRAEQLWGDGTTISVADIGAALAG